MTRKDELKKIIEMKKQGKISYEELIELLEALIYDKDDLSIDNDEMDKNEFSDITESISKIGRMITEEIVGRFSDKLGKLGEVGHDEKDNKIQMSRIETPYGDNFIFSDNKITLSSISNTALEHSHFHHSVINAASLKNTTFKKADFNNCKIQGSSFDKFSLMTSTMNNASFNGAKIGRFALKDKSKITNTVFNVISIKGLSLSLNAQIDDCSFGGFAISDSAWSDTKLLNTSMKGCVFDNVTFNHCKFKNSSFKDVILKNVTINNVTLVDYQCSHINLKDLIINGNDEFLNLFKLTAL